MARSTDVLDPPEPPRSATLILAAAVGIVAGYEIMMLGHGGWTTAEKAFARRPESVIWLAVVCAEVAGFAIAGILVLGMLRRLRHHGKGHWRWIFPSALLSVALIAGARPASADISVNWSAVPVPDLRMRTAIITSLGVVTAVATAIAMWLVHPALEKLESDRDLADGVKIERFTQARDAMKRLLAIQGAILGGAILGAGALRNAVLASPQHPNFPSEYVLIYGVFLSGLVALSYIPTQARISALGERLRRTWLRPAPSPSGSDWVAWHGRRKAIGEIMGLDVSAVQNLRAGAAILTPLVGAIVGVLVPGT